jgi:GNAT superfamily N-acetyltransferase
MLNKKELLALAVFGGVAVVGAGIGSELARRVSASERAVEWARHEGARDAVCELERQGFLDGMPNESNFPDDGTHGFHSYLRECGLDRKN